jgi:ferredoxin
LGSEIYYFSGTGNSLYAARELQKRLPSSKLLPIVRLLKNNTITTSADRAGLVFPNFCLSIPIPVRDFLKKVDFSAVRYFFAICTKGGSQSEAFDYIDILLKKQGKRLQAVLELNMPWNHPLGKENLIGTNTGERMRRMDTEMKKKMDAFSKRILAEKKSGADHEIRCRQKNLFSLAPNALNYGLHCYMYQKLLQFRIDSNCNGCGICDIVCLSRKIKMKGKKPIWQEKVKCYACYACINFCPQRAIQIKSGIPFVTSFTEINGRYHHKSVTYRDIAGQK